MPSAWRWLLAPVHALALATGAKAFADNPVMGHPGLNRRGLHLARRMLAQRMADRRRRILASLLPPEDRAALDRDGYMIRRDFLPPAEFAALRDELLRHATAAREFQDGATLTRLIPLDPAALKRLPQARRILTGARYRNLHDYAGSFRLRPHLFVQSIFSGVADAPPDVQTAWHTDTFHPTVKSWLLLTDVSEEDAAFTYVPGSHRPNARHLAWERRISIGAATSKDRMTQEGSLRIEDAALRRLGYGAPVQLAAPANTLIVADTSGFHRRGIAAGRACRIAIWAYARGSPFMPWPGGLVPEFGGGRLVRLYWNLQDLASRLAGKRGGWRWVGERTPATPPG